MKHLDIRSPESASRVVLFCPQVHGDMSGESDATFTMALLGRELQEMLSQVIISVL